jgi:putative SOS response-associated peptidase YedK
LAKAMRDKTGNLPPLLGILPDDQAPVVRNAPDGLREFATLRWGMPSSQKAQLDAARPTFATPTANLGSA